ncbi:hypothetical protein DUI87_29832 [Hirundo rustica rustica]|uniref:Serine-threonine/tyrosine-protein kinase catalytic domain-containing protein n=1 Tax=Hirundo rustica rustica TaxID=333673 RepID=A0A3M0J0C9_HIRRU|nr:hypothetical protein DUI87_29832 [Hirundo rustica rustica]
MAVPEPDARLAQEKEEESEEESEVLEESPCGRWQKRREQVNQGNMPGIQSTFLAMDTEEGVEVVWNELLFTDKKAFKAHEEKIKTMFEQLVLVDHPNIVKLHKYWLDVKDSKARVIFITEYVSSGSLKQFLKKTKKNHKAMNARALPDDLRSPIRIEREELRNLHFFPPEYGRVHPVLPDPEPRQAPPTANSLLFHRVLFEVHSLKLLAAHCFINHQLTNPKPPLRSAPDLMPENVVEEKIKELDLNMVMAEIRREGRPGAQWRYSEVSFLELDKFLEDVRNGIYPLMNFAVSRPHALPRALSQPQEDPQKAKTPTPEPFDVETRR